MIYFTVKKLTKAWRKIDPNKRWFKYVDGCVVRWAAGMWLSWVLHIVNNIMVSPNYVDRKGNGKLFPEGTQRLPEDVHSTHQSSLEMIFMKANIWVQFLDSDTDETPTLTSKLEIIRET